MPIRRFRKGTYNRYFKRKFRGKFTRRVRRRPNFRARVKRVLLRNAETKWLSAGIENIQLYHNTGVPGSAFVRGIIFDPWVPANITVGTGVHQRIGDSLIPRGMSVKIWLANKLDRPNIMYRIMVLVLPRMYNGAVVSYGSIDPCEPCTQGSNGNYLMLPPDKEKGVKTLYDRVISNEKGISGVSGGNKECHKLVKFWIKSKGRPIKYDQANGHVNNFLAVYVIPYDSYGSLITDNIASCSYHYKLYWKDP